MTSSNSNEEQVILATVAYFSLFEYPLTVSEIVHYSGLTKTAGIYRRVMELCLQSSFLSEKLIWQNGYCALRGQEEIFQTRLSRYRLSVNKYRIIKRALRWLAAIPSVMSVSVCNNLAINNAKSGSDLDLFIIVQPGKLWLTRFIIILLSQLFGLRIHPGQLKDKLCFSYLITPPAADLASVASGRDDIHQHYWLSGFTPVYGARTFEDFYRQNQKTLGELANLPKRTAFFRRGQAGTFYKFFIKPLYLVLSPFQSQLKSIQLKKMDQMKRELAAAGGMEIVISDQMLKFHQQDSRRVVADRYRRALMAQNLL